MPAEVEWIIKRHAPDPTSGSLRRADPTSASLREVDLTGRSLAASLWLRFPQEPAIFVRPHSSQSPPLYV